MAEFLEIPYTTVVAAAIVPALMHYIGVLSMVHFQAKRLSIKGMSAEEIPNLFKVLRRVADSATACGTDLCVVQRLLAEHGGILGNFYGRCGRASQSDAAYRISRYF